MQQAEQPNNEQFRLIQEASLTLISQIQSSMVPRKHRHHLCRIAVVGAHPARVGRVVEILNNNLDIVEHANHSSNSFEDTCTNSSDLVNGLSDACELQSQYDGVEVVYLPCVARFGFYEDANGAHVRYLVSIDYYQDVNKKPGTLLPFIDEYATRWTKDHIRQDDGYKRKSQSDYLLEKRISEHGGDDPIPGGAIFGPIAGVTIGVGIETEEDVQLITQYFESTMKAILSSAPSDVEIPLPKVQCNNQPSAPFTSMQQENAAFRVLSEQEKAEATRQGSMGPGKMACFVSRETAELIREWKLRHQNAHVQMRRKEQQHESRVDAVATMTKSMEADETMFNAPTCTIIDPSKAQYSCRKCRTVLFGEDDLQDPPHLPSRHHFSHHKRHDMGNNRTISASPSSRCQSYFLQTTLPWMMRSSSSSPLPTFEEYSVGASYQVEGKFVCPKCTTKLGTWNWSGSQCSCGTWVVPAIQIPQSKVDLILPIPQDNQSSQDPYRLLPTGTIVSPVLRRAIMTHSLSPGFSDVAEL